MKKNLQSIPMKKCTLLIAFSDLLKAQLIVENISKSDFDITSIQTDGYFALLAIREKKPDIVFLDSELPKISGIEIAKTVQLEKMRSKVFFYASRFKQDYLSWFLAEENTNIYGFIHKGCDLKDLKNGLKEIWEGNKYLSTSISVYINNYETELSEDKKFKKQLVTLSKREREIMKLISKGKSQTEIADQLCIGISTVKEYKNRIAQKMDLKNKQRLAYFIASKQQLLDDF
ncbi:DNA-binding response regulator, NarL/FixJ family, contains REC and HTH domains [Pseudarcicella hirudinis]|uniref:DNA-binding response regulator, NarL/FixJ family, contains REC and HTH domains n=1 Tax=Pseudarcicella hirudinis TaxID=1079859 RepID=A0A1I5YSS3_9BACT|nr:response regulator transcription factor [Pseudarcicella hirudinis]SFQ47266.1 DNA-binding response regulator, NarL/FixJ family, contains REC and HTH domains [Pseudarcicella hirudinis]